jgi:hypothetical protein
VIQATTVDDAKFFHHVTGYVPTLGFNGMKLTDVTGRILAMVGFDFWTPNAVQMHIYIQSPKYMTRKFIREVFNYAFITCGRGLVIGVTPSDNAPALEFNRRIGFVEKFRVEGGWSEDVDMVLQEMRAVDCRWLRKH